MSKSNIYKLGVQKAQSAATKQHKFYAFFEVLDEAVEPFKSGHKMPGANAGDSRFAMGRKRGKPQIKFEFIAKPNHVVTVVIDVKDLCANPAEYIQNMLECLNEGMKQATEDNRIIVPNAFKAGLLAQAAH